jgi:CubicO group peptidase (beta-lactamase class C family)
MNHLPLLLALGLALVPAAHAQLPVSGRPVPSLADFDAEMQDFMDDNDIGAGVLGVMHAGRVVYLRGFGHAYDGTTPLAENALFRIASCAKPITAAVIRRLIADGDFDVDDNAFDLGQAGGGVLDVTPFGGVGDDELEDVTIEQMLLHQGGWHRGTQYGVGDLSFDWREASNEMGVPSPPPRDDMMDWILGEPLQFTPGTNTEYSNIGYLALGLIAEQESGQDLLTFIRQRVLTPGMWVPATELQLGRSYRADQDPREPLYYSTTTGDDIFDNTVPYTQVATPYGTWHQEGLLAGGGFIASAPTILEFLQRYHTGVYDERIGEPVNAGNPLTDTRGHNGILTGTHSYMVQRPDSVNVFVVFNKRTDPNHYGIDFYEDHLAPLLDAGPDWPETTSDGFWVNMGGFAAVGFGAYSRPFASFTSALASTEPGSKLRLKAGSSDWTGVLSERLLLDAPLGSAVLGE